MKTIFNGVFDETVEYVPNSLRIFGGQATTHVAGRVVTVEVDKLCAGKTITVCLAMKVIENEQ